MTAPLRKVPLPSAADLNNQQTSTAAPDVAATIRTSADPRRPQHRPLLAARRRPHASPEVISSSLGAPGDRLPVVGLDPGWRHGTKWAACDPLGDVLATGVIHVTLGAGGRADYGASSSAATTDTAKGVAALADAMRAHG